MVIDNGKFDVEHPYIKEGRKGGCGRKSELKKLMILISQPKLTTDDLSAEFDKNAASSPRWQNGGSRYLTTFERRRCVGKTDFRRRSGFSRQP